MRKWTSEAKQELQDCFDTTNWSDFEYATGNLDELTDTVTSYTSFREDVCANQDLLHILQWKAMVHSQAKTTL